MRRRVSPPINCVCVCVHVHVHVHVHVQVHVHVLVAMLRGFFMRTKCVLELLKAQSALRLQIVARAVTAVGAHVHNLSVPLCFCHV